MNAARLKWLAVLALIFAVSYGVSLYRSNTVREYVTSAQVYWRADQAVITLTTGAEVRSEGLVARAVRLVGGWTRLATSKPEVRVGSARVFTFRNGNWDEQKLNPAWSPTTFPLWPYNGHFYTWDKQQRVSAWNGSLLMPITPQRTAELRSAFPNDPGNFLPAGSGKAPNAYDVVQDVITRDEWHAYRGIAALPGDKHLAFPIGDKTYEIVVRRDRIPESAGEVSLTVNGNGKSLPLFQAQPSARSVSAAEMAHYLIAQPLFQESASNRSRRLWIDFGGSLLALFVIVAIFLRPILLKGQGQISFKRLVGRFSQGD